MQSHVMLKHSMSRDSPTYKQLITECPVIPKCFVKEDGKVAEKRTEEEKATVDTSEKIIKQQMNTNLKLKEQTNKIKSVRRDIEKCNDSELQDLLNEETKLKEE